MSEEIKATQENTKETKKGFAELKKALIEQNEKDASKRAVELARTIANENKKIDELTAYYKNKCCWYCSHPPQKHHYFHSLYYNHC